ncbi:YcdB/YcdC domain-containing protein [Alicyclobacillus sp. SO9]|uniref:YcdB/YcdC domain-containing protein n=1 Tax=Alicyclobacillus sp. SO9 TaxID=2665646 RepID=UPI0018E863DF|nr:YcdB/YcdC domain-containing protein [Alicyclobacillus sp. SO9]QQE79267.1 hypothetical protein GI364_01790 [Alicyclobacillus sp. SO9]
MRLKAKFWALFSILGFFAAVNASVCTSQAASQISKQQAENIVSNAFHPGSVEKATKISNQQKLPEWNILYANGSTALVSMSGTVERFSSIATAASAKGKTTNKQAVAIARKLIQQLDPSHSKLVKLDPLHPNVLKGAQFTVSFTRVANGIPFPANGFKVAVNKNGSIGSYSRTWSNSVAFPEKKGVLSQQNIINHADNYLTSSPHVTLFYYMVPWKKTPQLLDLVQTKGGQVALYAKNGTLVTPPNSKQSSVAVHIPIYKQAWFKWTTVGVASVLLASALFGAGVKFGRRNLGHENPNPAA